MSSSIQSPCHPGRPLPHLPSAKLAVIDWEKVLTATDRPSAAGVDLETRQQILQSTVRRMRQVGYLRRLPLSQLPGRQY